VYDFVLSSSGISALPTFAPRKVEAMFLYVYCTVPDKSYWH